MANKTVTVKSSGGDYTSLNAALAGESTDLVTNTRILTVECYAMQDTTAADTGTGYTTSASYYINITVPTAERHVGVWNTDKYYLDISSSVPLNNQENFTRIDGLQIQGTNSLTQTMIACGLGTTPRVGNCIIRKNGGGGSGNKGIGTGNSSAATQYFYNNIIYDMSGASGVGIGVGSGSAGSYSYIYNNTIADCANGITYGGSNARAILKNNIVQGATLSYSGSTGADLASGYNVTEGTLSELAWGVGADSGTTSSSSASKLIESGQNFLTTVKVGMIIKNTTDTTYAYVTAIDSDTQLSISADIMASSEAYIIYNNFYGAVTFENEGANNFHLGAADTVAINRGTDLSGLGIFTTDIDGVTRTGTWDIGADEYVGTTARRILLLSALEAKLMLFTGFLMNIKTESRRTMIKKLISVFLPWK